MFGGETGGSESGEQLAEMRSRREFVGKSGEEADMILQIVQAALIHQPGTSRGGVGEEQPDEPFEEARREAGLAEGFHEEHGGMESWSVAGQMGKARVTKSGEGGGEIVIGEEILRESQWQLMSREARGETMAQSSGERALARLELGEIGLGHTKAGRISGLREAERLAMGGEHGSCNNYCKF